jgi:hypothetical protein
VCLGIGCSGECLDSHDRKLEKRSSVNCTVHKLLIRLSNQVRGDGWVML